MNSILTLNEKQISYLKSHLNVDSFSNSSDFKYSLRESLYYSFSMIFLSRRDKLSEETWNILVDLIKQQNNQLPLRSYTESKINQIIPCDSDVKAQIFENISLYLTSLYFPEQPKKSIIEKIISFFK